MTPEFARLPVHKRAAAMTTLAAQACGVSESTLSIIEPDGEALQLRRLAAWLMSVRAAVPTLDVAAYLGVERRFVQEACFLVRSRLARRGIRIDSPDAEIAAVAARLIAPCATDLARHAVEPGDCLDAICQAFGLPRAVLRSDGRQRAAARARFSFCWLASLATSAGPKDIGRWINRERTTVSHAIATIRALPGSAALLGEVLDRLDAGRPDASALLAIARRLEQLTADDLSDPTNRGLNP